MAEPDLKSLCKNVHVGDGGHGIAKQGSYQELPSKLKLTGGLVQGHGAQLRLVCSSSGKTVLSQVGVGGCDDDCSDADGEGGGLGGGAAEAAEAAEAAAEAADVAEAAAEAAEAAEATPAPTTATATACRPAGCVASVGCEWKIWLKRVKGGVAVTAKSTFIHHERCSLALNATEKVAAAATRDDIPADVLDEAQTWACKVPLSAVVDILRDKHAVDGNKPDWSLKDFANRLVPTLAEKTLDATRFVAELVEMRTSGYRTFYKTHASTCVLTCAMICFPEAIEDHAVDSATCDVYDSTFNTNRRNYKLGVFVYITRDGRTRIKAITLLLFEDQPSFACVLRWYQEAFGSHPLTLITDGDYALHLAIIELVAKHVKHIFGAAVAGKRGGPDSEKRWNRYIRKLWSTAKRSDIQSIPDLLAEWEEMRGMITDLQKNDLASGSIEAVLTWFGKPGLDDDNWGTLWGRRKQFCSRFTHSRFTWGAGSSGRCKGVNSDTHPRCHLLLNVLKLEKEANQKAELQNVLDKRSLARAPKLPPILEDMKTRIGLSAKGIELVAAVSSRLQCALARGLGMRAWLPARQVRKLLADESAPAAAGRRGGVCAPPTDGGATATDLERDRCYKLMIVAPSLFFRKSARGGHRTVRAIANRFAAWRLEDHASLIDGEPRERTQLDNEVKKAIGKLERGLVSDAARLLESHGVADIFNPEILEQMRLKHPIRKPENRMPDSLTIPDPSERLNVLPETARRVRKAHPHGDTRCSPR
ncbi:hypothetical protein T492DRAFT_887373 [Pavlovales sp. CCMP2436]|nr:hypothetical protein T492DRAFT_887373 [Pavlovales sp. CCMP2436]